MATHDAGNLNLLEFTREDVRWQRPHTLLEQDGVMLFAGASDFPAYNNGVHRVDDSVPGTEVVARAREFFAPRGRGFSLWVRDTGQDEDLREAAEAAGIVAFGDSPQMVCRARLEDRPLPEGVEIRMVEDAAGARDYADVVGPAYVSLGAPEGRTARTSTARTRCSPVRTCTPPSRTSTARRCRARRSS
jgi:hypothetical protein